MDNSRPKYKKKLIGFRGIGPIRIFGGIFPLWVPRINTESWQSSIRQKQNVSERSTRVQDWMKQTFVAAWFCDSRKANEGLEEH